MAKSFVFSSESVGEGHPDKVADLISDSVLDACLAQDRTSRVACETMVKSNMVIVAGEITTAAKLNYESIIRAAIRDIGYVNNDDVFHADQVFINNYLTRQSPDIAQGVDAKKAKGKKTAEQGAGDQGIMFGYACNETPELMPTPIMFAHRLGRELTKIRKSGAAPWLRPDAKSQVSVRYEDGLPVEIVNVVISTQHAASAEHAMIEKYLIANVIKKVLPAKLLSKNTEYLINPTGRFVVGGPQGDSGPQDHCGYLWWLGPPRWRRLLGQGSVQGRPLGRLHGSLGRQEHRRRGPRHTRRDPVRLRHRSPAAGVGARGYLWHCQGRPLG
jgi:S-adenosylmethionine synthetase